MELKGAAWAGEVKGELEPVWVSFLKIAQEHTSEPRAIKGVGKR